ncbi:TRAP transporter small permease subunit [Desulforhopalus vacuolatus]|uniref:TRAP transporter small permease subunit n=1 Tax=Desulforhopalus vacuolatus TaxID=40414 RepID=UPI0019626430|nr:TRAP transporter small permease subunit [Desulforhopalus vacuolatus]MBM9520598.1 TRAP transporter small permease subunit [Desulforhopalus vacuolatus]
MLIKAELIFHRLNRLLGKILIFILLLMTLNVFADVVMRYFFHNSKVGMQEMEWHLFSVLILFAMSYSLMTEGHVRVDFIYQKYSLKTRAMVNILGTIFFLIPLALLIFFGSFEFVYDAWEIGEISDDPGGLPCRWMVKGLIPAAFAMLLFFSLGYLIQNINLYRAERVAGEVKK